MNHTLLLFDRSLSGTRSLLSLTSIGLSFRDLFLLVLCNIVSLVERIGSLLYISFFIFNFLTIFPIAPPPDRANAARSEESAGYAVNPLDWNPFERESPEGIPFASL